MRALLTFVALASLTGCARFTTTQTDLSYATNSTSASSAPLRKITTKASAFTFFDANSALSKFKAIQTDKSQSASVGDLSQSSSGTNAVEVLDRIVRIMQALPK